MLIGLLSLRLQTSSASKISSAGKSPHELLNLYCFISSANYAWYLKLLPVVNRFTSTKVCYQQIGASLVFLPGGFSCQVELPATAVDMHAMCPAVHFHAAVVHVGCTRVWVCHCWVHFREQLHMRSLGSFWLDGGVWSKAAFKQR